MQHSQTSSLELEEPKTQPRPERAGSFKIWLFALFACLIACATGYWLTRQPSERDDLRAALAEKLDASLAGTFLSGLGRYIAPAKDPLPEQVIIPPTEKGTLAGRQISATIAAPLDFGEANAIASYLQARPEGATATDSGLLASFLGSPGLPPEEEVVFSQEALPPVTEDEHLRPDYIAGLARWLADRYRPGPAGGSLIASVQSLNQECGVKLAALAQGGRTGLLRYAFHPSMLNALYNLYIQRFMSDLNEAALARGLDEGQNRQFHTALAGHAAILANSLDGALAVSNLRDQLKRLDSLTQKAIDANSSLTSAVFELDELRQGKAPGLQAAQMRVDGAAARYRRATDDLAQAQSALINDIRKHAGQGLDGESLLFMASWVARRDAQNDQGREALARCSQLLRDFSARCRQIGENS